MAEPRQPKMLIGFWLRLLSDFLDIVFLLIFGSIIAIPLRPALYKVGESGAWIGLLVTALYFVIMHTSVGQGQTIAKRLLNIRVVRLDGSYLNWMQSLVRYSAIALIINNAGIMQTIMLAMPVLENPVFKQIFMWATVIWTLGLIVLVVLHPQKRGLHDLLAGSIVIRNESYDQTKLTELYDTNQVRRAFTAWILCSVVVIVGIVMLDTDHSLFRTPDTRTYNDLETAIEEQTPLQHTVCGVFTEMPDNDSQSFYIAGFLSHDIYSDEQQLRDVLDDAVSIVIESQEQIADMKHIIVFVRSGYNIGISVDFQERIEAFTPQGEYIENFIDQIKQLNQPPLEPDNTEEEIEIKLDPAPPFPGE